MSDKFILPTTLATKANPDLPDPELDGDIPVLVPGEDIETKVGKKKPAAKAPAKTPAKRPAEKLAE